MPHFRLVAVASVGVGLLGPTIGASEPLAQEEVRYTTAALILRAESNPTAGIVLRVPRAAKVVVSGCRVGWCAVRYRRADSNTDEAVDASGFLPQAQLSKSVPSAQRIRAPTRSRSCCRVCRKGKACGNSCIARNKTCHKGAGCACNG